MKFDRRLRELADDFAEHGRPPRWREWEHGHPGRAQRRSSGRWGWRELLAEAIGVRPKDINVSWEAVLDDRARATLGALRAVRAEPGGGPTAAEWDASGRRPASRTFARQFGNWRAACWAAWL
jgi:hypothetical protein